MTTIDTGFDISDIQSGEGYSSKLYEAPKSKLLGFIPSLTTSNTKLIAIEEHFHKMEGHTSKINEKPQTGCFRRIYPVSKSPADPTLSDEPQKPNYKFISPPLRCLSKKTGSAEFVNPSDLPKIERSRGRPFSREERAKIRAERNDFRDESLTEIRKDRSLNTHYSSYQRTLHSRFNAASVIASERVQVSKSVTKTRFTKAIKGAADGISTVGTTVGVVDGIVGSQVITAVVGGVAREGMKFLPCAEVAANIIETYTEYLELSDSEKLLHFVGDLCPLEVSKDLAILTTLQQAKSIKKTGSKPRELGKYHAEKAIDFIHENHGKSMPSKDLQFLIDRINLS